MHRNSLALSLAFVCFLAGGLSSCDAPKQAQKQTDAAPIAEAVATLAAPAYHRLPEGVTVPEGMVFVPGGQVDLGSLQGLPAERPIVPTTVDGFFLDVHPVTVAQFRAFVEATGYETQAEKFGDSGVFDFESGTWRLRVGANWEYPFGPDQPKAADNHPVTQVSWGDAEAYAAWADKRLPTEAEWEHAARNANNTRSRYPWGEEIRDGETYLGNYWQGNFPYQNTGQDGYMGPSPVGTFGKTPLGLTDMAGNVWEWCADWYESYAEDGPSLRQNPNDPEKVMRGGSYLCDPKVCHGFRVSGRSGTSPETGLCHLGFRCAMDLSE